MKPEMKISPGQFDPLIGDILSISTSTAATLTTTTAGGRLQHEREIYRL